MPRIVFCALWMLVLGIVFIYPSTVQAQEMPAPISYTVENIDVDVTADNAVEARTKAFEEAQLKGYKMLAERFLTPEEMENFIVPDINKVASYVKDFEVTNEQLSAVRYKGSYKIRYSPQTFAQNISLEGNVEKTSAASSRGELLVIPFYEVGGQYTLWNNNPFMSAWIRARSNQGAGQAIIPIGDLNDISSVRDEQGLNYDPAKLNAMRLRYRAKGALVAIATPQIAADGKKNLMVSLYRSKSFGPELAHQISVREIPGEAEDQTYNRAVSEVIKTLRRPTLHPAATAAVTQAPLSGPVMATVAQLNFSSAKEWVETKRALERARGVQSVMVKSLSPRSATILINHQGDIQTLKQSLTIVGVGLNDSVPQNGMIYQIYPARGTIR